MRILNKKMNTTIILLILIGSLLFTVYFFSKRLLGKKQLFQDTIIAENMIITPEWKEIEIQDVVKISKDVNLIGIVLKPPYEEPPLEKGIKIPTGEIINPEIKIIDEDGKEYLMTHYGSRGTEISNYIHRGPMPTNKIYKKLLLRSKFPIQSKRIIWSGYNVEDQK